MFCPSCKTKNEESAQFCKNCGMRLLPQGPLTTNTKALDTWLLFFIILLFVLSLVEFIVLRFLLDFLSFFTITGFFSFLQSSILILIAISIKNNKLKIIGVIATIIFIIIMRVNYLFMIDFLM